jgi:hypothetical protein
MSDTVKKPDSERPRYRFPEELTAEERAALKRDSGVDGEAFLRWLAGEGPDPCPPERSG